MADPQLACPACKTRVSGFDQYCGACGAVLARLLWNAAGERAWYSVDGHIAVRKKERSVRVRFRNEGVVPTGLVLRTEDIAELPPWVDRARLAETLLILPPSSGEEEEVAEIEIPLVPALLAPLFEEEEGSAPAATVREAQLPFKTNLNELRDGRWTSRPFKLTLRASRRPWISPVQSLYRFLPLEILAGAGIRHQVVLHNETAQPLELTEVRVADDPEAPAPPGHDRIPAASVILTSPLDRQPIEPGASWCDTLELSLADLPAGTLGWFSAVVEYHGAAAGGGEQQVVACRLQGRIGRGPTVRVVGSRTLTIPPVQIRNEHHFTLENPGQVPVAVTTLEVALAQDRPDLAPERDWLVLTGLSAGEVLAPGEVRTLRLRIESSRRSRGEYGQGENQRWIRILNDGLPGPSAALQLGVFVPFGEAKETIAGIDFGTTNSVVCVGGAGHSYALPLDRDLGQDLDRIRSLIFFRGGRTAAGGDDFVFGETAFSSAAVRPENLVRSIKTVVARDPRTRYIFYRRTSGSEDRRLEKTPEQLLDLFISNLRTRAEQGVSTLPPEAGEDLGLDIGTQLAFSRAVFSHPYDMTPSARRALMNAAHAAGINESVREVDTFFEASCIDEATAAVLAYVQLKVQNPPIQDLPLVDEERVLCFDMGGGTTDLATVEVLGMKKLHDKQTKRVVVNLAAKNGEHFGGDDLDQMLAERILREVRRQSEEQGAPVVVADLQRAIRSRSYSDFEIDFWRRRNVVFEQDAAPAAPRIEDDPLGIYKLATDILVKAETLKRKLSTDAKGLVDLSGTGWPRTRKDSQAEAQNFVIHIERTDFEGQVRQRMRSYLPMLDSVVKGARWEWPSVTTLLFTGQGARVPAIREEVSRHVAMRRGAGAPPLLLEPDTLSFDPKNCVAIGAAIWGANRHGGGAWVEIRNGASKCLPFDLGTRAGGFFVGVLEGGSTLPATGKVPVEEAADYVALYKINGREPYVTFRFPPLAQAGDLVVRVDGPSAYFILIGDRDIAGEVSR